MKPPTDDKSADMRKGMAAFGSIVFLVVAPGTVAGLVPWAITRWAPASPEWPQTMLAPFAAVLIGAGLIGLLDSFVRFAVQGLGTPTPLLPTKQLIVTGLYRYVRNPMYVAVLALIYGQALLFGATWLAIYGAAIWVMFHLSVVIYEEPRLLSDYGHSYAAYCQHVRRWLPRYKPWRGE